MKQIQEMISRAELRVAPPAGSSVDAALFGIRSPGRIIYPDQTDELQGLPAFAANAGGMFTPALADDEPRHTPDVDQMLEDLAAAGVMMMGRREE